MASPPAPTTRPAGFSLYANLLGKTEAVSAAASIEKAPVVFKQPGQEKDEGATPASKISASTLRFQPSRRPAAGAKTTKPKIGIKPIGSSSSSLPPSQSTQSQPTDSSQLSSQPTAATSQSTSTSTARPVPVVKSTVEDWTNTGHSDDDVNNFYSHKEKEKERRRKKRKKNREEKREVDWDDIYDPERPNNYEEYRESEEKFREMEDWRARLYGRKRERSESLSSDGSRLGLHNRGFAPPASFSAVPPPPMPGSSQPAPPPVDMEAPTGEDAYARRIRLGQQAAKAKPTFHPPPAHFAPPPQFAPPSSFAPPTSFSAPQNYTAPPSKRSPPDFHTGFSSPELSARCSSPPYEPTLEEPPSFSLPPPSTTTTQTITSAPVLYSSSTTTTIPARSRSPTPERTNRPGQKGFAARLMSKYGWSAGTGLGASQTGIVKPLQAIASKGQAGHGKIIDKNKTASTSTGKFGKMSAVIELEGMLENVAKEDLENGELVQEIGEECAEKYGVVERVRFGGKRVYVKFTSEVSALRAVNALEGRLFNGSTIRARFFEVDKWEEMRFD